MDLFLTLVTTHIISVRMQSGCCSCLNLLKLPLCNYLTNCDSYIYSIIPLFHICIPQYAGDQLIMQHFISVIILHCLFLWLKSCCWASLVAQWLRICLLMQGTRVRALVWEDPTCRGAAGPVSHNC